MFVDNAFGDSFVIDICDNTALFKSDNFVADIDKLYDLIKNINQMKPQMDKSQIGEALSTVVLHDTHLLVRPSIKPLLDWVSSRIVLAGKHLPTTGTNFKFTRAWTNRMFNECEGKCHIHNSKLSGVAIFYLDVPSGSSDLVFIKDGRDGTVCADYDDINRKHISPMEGMLVIHPPKIPHAITKHASEKPRTCLIFEFVYE